MICFSIKEKEMEGVAGLAQWMICLGYLRLGYAFIGPFGNKSDAAEHGEDVYPRDDWSLVPLFRPADGDRTPRQSD